MINNKIIAWFHKILKEVVIEDILDILNWMKLLELKSTVWTLKHVNPRQANYYYKHKQSIIKLTWNIWMDEASARRYQ